MTSVSEAVPMTCTGRECGTSARSAPRLTVIGTSKREAMPTNWAQNSFQRNAGSGPRASSTSPPGVEADQTPTVGHTIVRRPWSRRTCGRTVAKSVNASGSISATAVAPQRSTSVRTALDAASPASFHPVNAHTRVGARSSGSDSHRTCSMSARYPHPRAGRR